MTKVAQEVILKQISDLKDQVSRLERVVKDYFLWLDMHDPTLREADAPKQPCPRCNDKGEIPEPIFGRYMVTCPNCGGQV